MWAKHNQNGFTIVELLIVIVVIGILAAISIVAYSGIQQRAVAASLISDLDNASKRLKLYQVDNSAYPTVNDCSVSPVANSICLKSSGSTVYPTLTVNNATNPQTFCLTATSGTSNYYVNQDGVPTSGTCAIANLEPNPSFEAIVMANAGAGTGTRSLSAARSVYGSNSTQYIWAAGGATGMQTSSISVSPLTTYNLSMYVYSESGQVPGFIIAAADYATNVIAMPAIPSTGQWQRISKIYTTLAGQTTLRAWTTVNSASTFYVDGILVTNGSTLYNYADGNSPGWTWSGSVNNSISSGPSL